MTASPADGRDRLTQIATAVRGAPVVSRDGYEYFVHGITDGIPQVDPTLLSVIATEISSRLDCATVDRLVAPEAMGIHHTTALALETGLPFVVVRKRSYGFSAEISVEQETSYGESEFYINGVTPGDRVVLVDDVLSSGNTIRAIHGGLENAGATVVDVIVVLRRTDTDHGELPCDITSLLDVAVEDGTVVASPSQ